ncbi:hypothetical protein [Anaerosporobacter faecicola]|uniref:hypothetical protein n=1 Tax=Anaerosporobacter faecicola TaxID=2718714 RepID=UPI00143B3142|nr:hypothetical protein [Anaerosporobacter faecicola]
MKQCIAEFVNRSWSKEEKVLVVVAATLLGVVAGFIFSPFQKGINVFSHNGSNNSNNGNPQQHEKEIESEE